MSTTAHSILIIFTGLCLLTAAMGIHAYVSYQPELGLVYAAPGLDGSEQRQSKTVVVTIGELFERKLADDGIAFDDGEPWPGFRGPARDNIAAAAPPLQTDWGADGPRVLWRQSLGEGYAAPAVAYGRVYVLDHLEEEEADALRCFVLADGRELWRRGYRNPMRRNHGKSRTIPAVAENTVVTLGPQAHVMASDAISGDFLWGCDLVREYGAEVPQWYSGQCPLIDQGAAILAPAGQEWLLLARDLRSGEVRWQLANTPGLKMSHGSVVPMCLHGVRQYVYAGIGGVVGVSEAGELLWCSREWQPPVWAPSPVQLADNRIFLTAGYGAGSALLEVVFQDGAWSARLLGRWKATQAPACEQQTPIYYQGMLFTIQPKDAGALRAQLVAADPSQLPAVSASSGREQRFGIGPFLVADGCLWIVDDEGLLSVYRYQQGVFERLASHRVLSGVDSWGPIAMADGLMIVRDDKAMACLDLRRQSRLAVKNAP
ncbi:MAG: PQQ-binding-like beta-propeller repeat protein [Lentisphaerae bacterium]|nr:PQQ-binding-like beta-propeller repeat protein [Lentisphaerota bacterium]